MRLPLVPTLMVAAMLPTMLGLGIWQLQRAEWKQDLLDDLERAPSLGAVDLDRTPSPADINFRRVAVTCSFAGKPAASAGRSVDGVSGFALRLSCRDGIDAVVGWSTDPRAAPAAPTPARVTGRYVEADGADLVFLDRPLPPLAAAAPPTVETIPNNHRAYAAQWFLFAGILTLIYGLYLRRRA